MEIVFQFILLVIGFAALIKGADFFVDGAAGVADKFGIPQIIIGLTIVALGTSAPEAAVSITSALKGSASLAVGNVLGSNIMNVLLILGLTAVIKPIKMQVSTYKYELPFVMFVTVLLAVLAIIGGSINFVDGIILCVFLVLFFVYLFKSAKSGKTDLVEMPEEGDANAKPKPIWLLILLILLGGAMIVIGSNLTVDSASFIAAKFGMSERLIGLTIVAFGTSLPELVTSAVAAKKGNSDIAIGNIVGSNIFNILFILGITALITNIPFAMNFTFDAAVALAALVLLFVLVSNKEKTFKRWGGAVMLASYAAYFAYILVK
ncbi:MAG: calcium/sodium antiporter [Oscillospiraceae bacterium]